jgi:dienelactone hydrolase
MIAAGFFAGAGCKPDQEDNCTAPDNATTPTPAYAGIESFTTQFGQRNDFVDMYYPAGADNATKLPMALLLQGGRCDKKYYSMFASGVAKYGFIVAVPNNYHQFKLGPMDTDGLFSEASQMYDYIDYMKAQNDNSSSPFYKKVDTEKLMMLGHSYGAACTIYALQDNCISPFCPEGEAATWKHPEELKAAALCGINSKPRGKPFDYKIYPTNNQGLPLAFVNGSLDNNAKAAVTKKSYDKIADPPKMLVLIKGANHYASLDVNNPPAPAPDGSLGKGPGEDPNEPELSQEVSSEIAARWCALFLRAYGLDDPLARLYVEQTGTCLDDQVEVMIQAVQP